VARLGGRGFTQILPAAELLEAVTQVLQQARTSEAKVMAVDDDPVLVALRNLLEPWGLKVLTLDDPQRFWETLEESAPDLLVWTLKCLS